MFNSNITIKITAAEAYGQGACERSMGEAIKTLGWKRTDLVLGT